MFSKMSVRDKLISLYTVCVENKFRALLRDGVEEQSPNKLLEGMKEAVIFALEQNGIKRRKKQLWIGPI